MELLLGVVAAAVSAVVGYRFGRSSDPSPEPAVETRRAGADARDVERALADLRLGVVVVAADGREVYRNNRGKDYATGRHGDALVEAAMQRVVEGALLGLSLEEAVEVYGPPARSFQVQASPTYAGGRLTGAVGVIDDVTETRHILRVRSDFVANVSHELRTPVGAMSVLAETIAEADDPDVVERLSQRILREATRLADTIDDLLTLSRLESGPVDDPETVDLVSVALMAIERTAETADQRQVRVTIDPASVGPVLIEGDRGQLVSAVANLVENAVKYSESGGEVEVRVGIIAGRAAAPSEGAPLGSPVRPTAHRAAADREGRWLGVAEVAELSVFDDGIGIPERDMERIFERFYRVDSGRSRETGGTGLGLSIVRHVLINHQGTVDVESMEGQGSTFTIRLPLSDSPGQVTSADDSSGRRRTCSS